MNAIFKDFTRRDADLWGAQPMRLSHSLADLDLFSDSSLESLIDDLPHDQIMVNTMAADGHDSNEWAFCDRGDLSGAQILDAVRNGRLWINMVRLHQTDPRFRDILDRIYAEIEENVPGLRTSKRRLGLLVSSPCARVYYHCDVPCQTLWQLRGHKRIWIYPPSTPFLRANELEDVVRQVTEEEVTYEPWFDDYAHSYDLAPGDMLHWPLNAPHRIVNANVLNVSLTTEHWTAASRRVYLMNYGNGVLRSHLGWAPRSRTTDGPGLIAKAGLATAARIARLRHQHGSVDRTASYVVDPDAPLGRRAAGTARPQPTG